MIFGISADLAYPGATLYLLDFNFYIGSRTFIGSILTLLTPHITYQQIFGLNLFIYAALIAAFSVLGFSAVKKSLTKGNNILFLLLLAFIVFPYSLLQYSGWVSAYDLYLCLFAALSALAAFSDRTHWLFPLFCVMAIFTHYSFVFAYFPAVFAVHTYCIITSNNKKSRIASSALAFISSFISSVYCVFFANNTIKMTRDELYAYMESRLGLPAENRAYFDLYYFNEDPYGALGELNSTIITEEFMKNFLVYFFPVILLFLAFWCYYTIKAKKLQGACGLIFLGASAVNIALIFLMYEAPRWQAAAMLSQFIILFVLIRKEDSTISYLLSRLNKPSVSTLLLIFVILTAVASLSIKPFYG